MTRNNIHIRLFIVAIVIHLNCIHGLSAQTTDSLNLAIDFDCISRTQGVKHVIPTMPILFEDINQIPDFTNKTANSFIGSHGNPVSFIHLAYRLLGATAGGFGPPLSGVGDPFYFDIKSIDQICQVFYHQFGFRFNSGSENEWQKLSSAYRIEILKTIYAIYKTNVHIMDFLKPLNSNIKPSSDSIEINYQRLFKPWKEKQLMDFTTFDILQSIDLKKLSFASRVLMEQTHRLINFKGDQNESDFSRCLIETQFGPIGIFGIGNDTINEEFTLIIDLGGNDNYYSNCGSSIMSDSRIAILIDEKGDDNYSPGENFLASGIMGIGLLFDLQGNDSYISNKSGIAHSFFGTSFLYDLEGNDIYRSNSFFSQGSAHVGAAILFDNAGDDNYISNSYSQGFGGTLGVGILLDSEGSDSYNQVNSKELPSFVQGASMGRWAEATDGQSLGGGYGIFIDLHGDDKYGAKSFSQGASYYFGMGMFYDGSGDDKYNATSHSQGYSAHYGLASFCEMAGDDIYNKDIDKNIISQIIGGGRDYSSGWFLDIEGNDAYYFGNRSVGIGDMNGIGFFWDKSGDDQYYWYKNTINPASNSMGHSMGVDNYQSVSLKLFTPKTSINKGFFLDNSGKDTFNSIEL